jgi:hypothetical protein
MVESRLENPDELEDQLELANPKVQNQIAESYKAYLRGEGRDVDEFLRELQDEPLHKR